MLKEYMTMLNLLGEESLRVKAYYPIAHTLKSFGSDFAFKDTDLATCASVRKVFNSFLYMAERIDSWGRNGVLVTSGQQKQKRIRIDATAFKKEISNLRIEVSFVIDVGNKHDKRGVVLESIERLLERDVNLIFGVIGSSDADKELEHVMTSRLCFIAVNDWLAQVRAVREMLTSNVEEDDDETVNLALRRGWSMITSRAKQQAECLQSLLGYCCRKTNQSVRSRSWEQVWNANAEKEYPGR
jgi:hypothetical protein